MRLLVGLGVVALLVSGFSPGPIAAGVSLPTAQATSPDWNTTIVLNQSGAGGDWLFFYHVLNQPLPQDVFMRFNGTFALNAASDGHAGVIYSVPGYVSTHVACCNDQRAAKNAVTPELSFSPNEILGHFRAFTLPAGQRSFPVEEYMGAGASTSVHAIAFVIGSSEPWSLNLTFQLVSGQTLPDDPAEIVGQQVQPTYAFQGHNMTFQTFYESPGLTLRGDYTSGSIHKEVQIASEGWTQVQYDWYNALDDYRAPKQPFPSPGGTRVGIHQYRTEFPNGYLELGPASVELNEPGVYFPIPLRAWGAMADQPGPLHLSILRADNSVNISATVVHLPIAPASYPSDLQLWNYQCQSFDLEWRNPIASGCDEAETDSLGVDGGVIN